MRKLARVCTCLVMVICLFTGTRGVLALGDGSQGERHCFPPPAGLTGWWPGDGHTEDIIGGRTAVLHGDARTGPGLVDLAFILDGDGDFVDVPDNPALKIGTGDFTVALWVYFNDTAGEQVLVEKYIQRFDADSQGWTLTKLEDNALVIFMASADGEGAGVGTPGPLPFEAGTWTHVAATRRGSQYTLFMNGVPVASAEGPSLNADSESSLKLGHRGAASDTPGSQDERGFFVNGRVDEVQLFVGHALTRGQIRAIFNAGSAGMCKPEPGIPSVTYWPFTGGSTRDFSGNHNDGVRVGITPTSDRFGRQNHAFQFDGLDDYVQVANSPSLQIGTSDYTIAAWIKTTDASNNGRVFSKGSWNCTAGYMMRLGGDKVHLENASGWCGVNLNGNTTVTDGAWHFIVGVVDRKLGAAIYVDGLLDATQPIDTSAYDLSNDRNPTIGVSDGREFAPAEFFNGTIDDVRIYNTALSASEVRALYRTTQSSPSCIPRPAGLTNWWPGDGTTADIIGGQTAVLYGNATTGPGLLDLAFILDGDGDFVAVPDNPALDFGSSDFTVALWVYVNNTVGEQILIEKWIQGWPYSHGWTLTKLVNNVLLLAMDDGSGEIDVPSGVLPIVTGAWIHVAATRQGNQITLFMNGMPVAGDEPPLRDLASTSSLKFGHRGIPADTPGSAGDNGAYLNGRIDEVQLFVGRALSSEEVGAIFAAGSAGVCK